MIITSDEKSGLKKKKRIENIIFIKKKNQKFIVFEFTAAEYA